MFPDSDNGFAKGLVATIPLVSRTWRRKMKVVDEKQLMVTKSFYSSLELIRVSDCEIIRIEPISLESPSIEVAPGVFDF